MFGGYHYLTNFASFIDDKHRIVSKKRSVKTHEDPIEVKNVDFWRYRHKSADNLVRNFLCGYESKISSSRDVCGYCKETLKTNSQFSRDNTIMINNEKYINITNMLCIDHLQPLDKIEEKTIHFLCLAESYIQIVYLYEFYIKENISTGKLGLHKIFRGVFETSESINKFFEILKIIIDLIKTSLYDGKPSDKIGCLRLDQFTMTQFEQLIQKMYTGEKIYITKSSIITEEKYKPLLKNLINMSIKDFIELKDEYEQNFLDLKKEVYQTTYDMYQEISYELSLSYDLYAQILQLIGDKLLCKDNYNHKIYHSIFMKIFLSIFFNISVTNSEIIRPGDKIKLLCTLNHYSAIRDWFNTPYMKKTINTCFERLFIAVKTSGYRLLEEIRFFLIPQKSLTFNFSNNNQLKGKLSEYLLILNITFGYVEFLPCLTELVFTNYDINVSLQIINYLSSISPNLSRIELAGSCGDEDFMTAHWHSSTLENIKHIIIRILHPSDNFHTINLLVNKFIYIERLDIHLIKAHNYILQPLENITPPCLTYGCLELNYDFFNSENADKSIVQSFKYFENTINFTLDTNKRPLPKSITTKINDMTLDKTTDITLRNNQFTMKSIYGFLLNFTNVKKLFIDNCVFVDIKQYDSIDNIIKLNILQMNDISMGIYNFKYIIQCDELHIDYKSLYDNILLLCGQLNETLDDDILNKFCYIFNSFVRNVVIITKPNIQPINGIVYNKVVKWVKNLIQRNRNYYKWSVTE